MNRVIYFAYYSDPDTDKARMSVPSAVSKIGYVADVIRELGYETEIWSLCRVKDRSGLLVKYPGYVREANGIPIRFFDRYSSRFKLIRGAALLWSDHRIRKQVLDMITNDDKVIVYHSLSSLHLIRTLKRKHIPFVLDTEEIYADVIGKKSIRAKELAHIRSANGYILPTQLFSNEVNPQGKPEAIVHGVYSVKPSFGEKRFGDVPGERRFHCIYAGTLDPRKGSQAAVRAAAFLSEEYHLHVLGFGTQNDTEAIKALIKEINAKAPAKVTFDGLKTGDDYLRFLQCCDIGLCTQDPGAPFSDTSFPSKILSYLSNGLKVVSVRIPAVETSAVGGSITYYDEQTPEAIAGAIREAAYRGGADAREELGVLSDAFAKKLKVVLESI